MKDIWYLLNCQGREEQATVDQCKKFVSAALLEAAWIIRCQKLLRYQGEWHVAERNLFPGYVMLSVPDGQESRNALEEVLAGIFPQSSRGERNGSFYAVGRSREERLKKLCRGSTLVCLSRGCIYGRDLIVTGGPLAGYEGSIRKIDRHKRTAWVEMPKESPKGDNAEEAIVLGTICVGLEVYEKHIQD